MNKKKFISVANDVINLEIKALQKLKKNINKSFNNAVIQICLQLVAGKEVNNLLN